MRTKQRFYSNNPAPIIVTMIAKGGAGKTTLTATLAALLAKAGFKVLVVDLDPQANLSSHMAFDPQFQGNVSKGLIEGYDNWAPERMVEQVCSMKVDGIKQEIDLVPAHHRLEETMTTLGNRQAKGDDVVEGRLKKCLDLLRPYYDYILVDTPPARQTMSVQMCLHAADTILIPVDSFDALDGMAGLLSTIQGHQKVTSRSPHEIFMLSPSCPTLASSPPYGICGVKNSTWYPMMVDRFPHHFIPQVVRRSNTVQNAARPGMLWSGYSDNFRRMYRDLYTELITHRIGNKGIVPLTTWMEDPENFDMGKFKGQIRKELAKGGTEPVTKRTIYKDCAPPKRKTPVADDKAA